MTDLKPVTEKELVEWERQIENEYWLKATSFEFVQRLFASLREARAETLKMGKELGIAQGHLTETSEQVEQLRVQLAGCGVAVFDGSEEQAATRAMYGWSPVYQDVLNLRREHNKMLAKLAEIQSVFMQEPSGETVGEALDNWLRQLGEVIND